MASRLRLNPSKTQVMWLGSSQQLDKINIRDVPLLSASVTVVNTARDLGVILDLTVNCRWTRTLLLSAGAVTIPTEAALSRRTISLLRQLRGICI